MNFKDFPNFTILNHHGGVLVNGPERKIGEKRFPVEFVTFTFSQITLGNFLILYLSPISYELNSRANRALQFWFATSLGKEQH